MAVWKSDGQQKTLRRYASHWNAFLLNVSRILFVIFLLPPANEVAERWCFHKRMSRILSTVGGEVYTPLGRQTPPPPSDRHCSRRYASYWNAFLFTVYISINGRQYQNIMLNLCFIIKYSMLKLVYNLWLYNVFRFTLCNDMSLYMLCCYSVNTCITSKLLLVSTCSLIIVGREAGAFP